MSLKPLLSSFLFVFCSSHIISFYGSQAPGMCLCAKPLHSCYSFTTLWTQLLVSSLFQWILQRILEWNFRSQSEKVGADLDKATLLIWQDPVASSALSLHSQQQPYEAMAEVSVLSMVVRENPSLFHRAVRDQLRVQWGPRRLPGVEDRLYWLRWEWVWSNP